MILPHLKISSLAKSAVILLLALFPSTAFSQMFNENLSEKEKALLDKGEIVIRYINDMEKSCINPDISPSVEKVRVMMKNLQPNYLCEVLYSVPVEGNEDFISQVESIFDDSKHYLKIMYRPEEDKKTKHLFKQSILDETLFFEQGRVMKMRFQMEPFKLYHANMVLESDPSNFSFTHTNLDTLTYLGIRVIKPNRMLAGLAITKQEDRFFIYAAGGLNAWKPFVLRSTLEKMFNNRMKDFSVFYINQIHVK